MNRSPETIRVSERLLSMGFTPFLVGTDKKPLYPWKEVTAENAMTKIKTGVLSNPNANIAIPIPRGCIAVDIDKKHGKDGEAYLRNFAPDGWNPISSESGPVQVTPTGGFHLLYRLPPSLNNQGNGRGSIPEDVGVDVRANARGYIVAAPSVGENGKPYSWLNPLVAVEKLPILPLWVEELLLPEPEVIQPQPQPALAPINKGDRCENVLVSAMNRIRSATPGKRNGILNREAYSVAGVFTDEGGDTYGAREALAQAARDIGLGEHEITATLNSAFNSGEKKPLAPKEQPRPTLLKSMKTAKTNKSKDRPEISVDRELHEIDDDAVEALRRAPNVYQRDGHLSRVIKIGEDEDSKLLPAGSLAIRKISPATLKETFSKVAVWTKYDSRKKQDTHTKPPSDVISAVLDRGEYPHIRTIVGITETPFMRPDGSVCDVPGYDRASKFIFNPSIEFPKIPMAPTKEQASESYNLVCEPFLDFPFVDETHRAVAISGVLSILARPMLGNIPASATEASTRGSGKTLVDDVKSMITTGRPAPKLGWPVGESWDRELDVTLSAIACDAPPLIVFDNIPAGRKVGGAALDKVLTSNGAVKFRTLGKSETPELTWKTVVFLNGNNIVSSIADETRRRVLPCRMVPDCERPEDRTGFRHPDLLTWVSSESGRLVAAALTILRYWVVSGRPPACDPWGSFESWSQVIPGAIVAAGGPNIMECRKLITESDDEDSAAWHNLLEVLNAKFIQGATAADILNRAEQDAHLKRAIAEAVPSDNTNVRSFGKFLSGRKDRIFGDYRLIEKGKSHKVTVWTVIKPSGGGFLHSVKGDY